MRITCPRCGFSKEVGEEKIPVGEIQITCPQCLERFPRNPFEGKNPGSVTGEMTPALEKYREIFPAAFSNSVTGNREASDASLPPAGFWIRMVASLVDLFVLGGLQLGFGLLFTAVLQRLDEIFSRDLDESGTALIGFLFSLVIGFAYPVFFTGYCGQTPGKMALRAKVVRNDGEEIGFFRALLRETVGKFLSAALLGAGFLMVGFTGRKRGLHDLVAGSRVVKLS